MVLWYIISETVAACISFLLGRLAYEDDDRISTGIAYGIVIFCILQLVCFGIPSL